jgi:cytochrome bd-type quinol oxidase subunit 2
MSVIAVNAWMNQPGGFTVSHGQITSVDFWPVFFNHAAAYEMPHMILAAYMVTGFTVAGVYAAGIVRGRRDRYHYTGFAIPFVLVAVLTPVQIIVGDTAARAIAHDQPVKFAAMEYVTRMAAVGSGALSLAALAALHGSNPALYTGLTDRALPLVILAGVCGLTVLALVATRRFTVVRAIAALGVVAVVWGWGVAQYPVLLPGTAVTLTNAGAPQATFDALIVLFVMAVLLVGPSFALLYHLQGRRLLSGEPAPATSVVKSAACRHRRNR